FLYWEDYFINWGNIVSTYNAGYLNRGSWYNWVPGWVPQNSARFVEAPFFAGLWYPAGFAGTAILCCFIMRKVKERRPQIGVVGVILVCFGSMLLVDLWGELLYLVSGTYHYAGYPGPRLFAGHYYAFPFIEGVGFAATLVGLGCLRWFRNDKGESFAERGVES